jgi:hypothetical protein
MILPTDEDATLPLYCEEALDQPTPQVIDSAAVYLVWAACCGLDGAARPQNVAATPALKAAMYRFVVRVALRPTVHHLSCTVI